MVVAASIFAKAFLELWIFEVETLELTMAMAMAMAMAMIKVMVMVMARFEVETVPGESNIVFIRCIDKKVKDQV